MRATDTEATDTGAADTGSTDTQDSRIENMQNIFQLIIVFCAAAVSLLNAQQSPQNPSPIVENTRPHPRIAQVEVPGRRVELVTLKGAIVSASPKLNPNKPVPLIIHFHGVPWLMEYHIGKHFPNAALITVNLGSDQEFTEVHSRSLRCFKT